MNERVWIKDEGVERGAEKLTPERIEKTINAVFDNEAGARLKAYVDTCAHCGCVRMPVIFSCPGIVIPAFPLWAGQADHLGNARQERQGFREFMKQAIQVAQTECNMCRRCVQYCPLRHRHCLHDVPGAPHRPQTGNHAPLHSGYGAFPCRA